MVRSLLVTCLEVAIAWIYFHNNLKMLHNIFFIAPPVHALHLLSQIGVSSAVITYEMLVYVHTFTTNIIINTYCKICIWCPTYLPP